MKIKIFLYAFLALMLLLLPHNSKAAELITNGGFETGTFSGWTAVNVSTNVWFNWRVTAASCDACLDSWTNGGSSPHSGTRSAWNGWAAGAPVPDAFRLRQTVTIPNNPNEMIRLTWWQRLQWNLAFQAGSTVPQHVIVNVLNPSNNAVIQEVSRFTAPAASQGPTTPPGAPWQQRSANLSAYKGQTIRLEIICTVGQDTMGPGICEFDDISLQNIVPTAAGVSLGGRVTNAEGQPIARIDVTLTDGAGLSRKAVTGSFGYYDFDNLRAGETYIVTVKNRKYLFTDSPRVLNVQQNLTDVDFVASP